MNENKIGISSREFKNIFSYIELQLLCHGFNNNTFTMIPISFVDGDILINVGSIFSEKCFTVTNKKLYDALPIGGIEIDFKLVMDAINLFKGTYHYAYICIEESRIIFSTFNDMTRMESMTIGPFRNIGNVNGQKDDGIELVGVARVAEEPETGVERDFQMKELISCTRRKRSGEK